MAILTTSGRTALAKALANETLHLAWGSGDAAWDETPELESIALTALVSEAGRRRSALVAYCVESETGDIIVPSGQFQSQLEPAPNLYVRFNFDFEDAATAEIREAAIFMGTVTNPSLPSGQLYFVPNEVVDPGTLVAIERFPVIYRSSAVRQSFEFVLTL